VLDFQSPNLGLIPAWRIGGIGNILPKLFLCTRKVCLCVGTS